MLLFFILCFSIEIPFILFVHCALLLSPPIRIAYSSVFWAFESVFGLLYLAALFLILSASRNYFISSLVFVFNAHFSVIRFGPPS